jgi:predicted ABC-type ATPase
VSEQPLVVLIGGPNGAGKTTSAPTLLQGALAVGEFVNADAIAMGLSLFRPERVAMDAGRAMLARLRVLARERKTFAFETTLASRTFAPWLIQLRSAGYRAHLCFVSLPNADLAVARVTERVAAGGHSVPETIIRRRFKAGLRNLTGLYLRAVDSWQVVDNSDRSGPRPIASGTGSDKIIVDEHAWQVLFEAGR